MGAGRRHTGGLRGASRCACRLRRHGAASAACSQAHAEGDGGRHTQARVQDLWDRVLPRQLHAAVRCPDDRAPVFEGGRIPFEHRWALTCTAHQRLAVSNTTLFCLSCGAWGAWKLQKLKGPCNLTTDGRPITASARNSLKRLVNGRSPQPGRGWPGGAAAGTRFHVYHVSHAVCDT